MKLVVALLVIWAFLLTGCPSSGGTKSTLNKGFEASVRISTYGTDLTNSIVKLHESNAISDSTFKSLIDKLSIVAQSGRTLHNTLSGLLTKYPDGNVPAAEFSPVSLLFNTNIYTPVIEIITELSHLTPSNKALISVALSGLKAAVFTIKTLMDKSTSMMLREAHANVV